LAKVHLTGFLLPSTMADADLVAQLLPEHIRLTRLESGCLTFEVVRSQSDPMRFALREVFANLEAFEDHQTRTRASTWWEKTRHIERDFKVTGG
jgi:quinol monooxygenase YgiN